MKLNTFLSKAIESLDNRITPYLLLIKTNFFWKKKQGKPHNLSQPLIISLTSYPPRFKTLHLTIKCLLSQSITPDKVILWIADKDKNLLEENTLKLINFGLEIKYCDDYRSYKKIIPALQEFKFVYIVTADDDIYYWSTWLEELVKASHDNREVVISHRAHKINLDKKNIPLPYLDWELSENRTSGDISPLNFPTGCGGILYPPQIFHENVCNIVEFSDLCPSADDVWLYWMVRLNKRMTRKIESNKKIRNWPSSQKNSLCKINVEYCQNDIQISNMTKKYPIFNQ